MVPASIARGMPPRNHMGCNGKALGKVTGCSEHECSDCKNMHTFDCVGAQYSCAHPRRARGRTRAAASSALLKAQLE
jgi:hypothetical protein